MTKFNFHIFQTANKFHIISNLTNWHFSCRPRLNKWMIEEFGELTKQERDALNKFKKLLLKYNFGSFKKSKDDPGKFLGIPLITSPDNEVWLAVEEWVEESEYQVIRRVFDVFEERFQKIWRRELPKLRAWKVGLDKELKKKRYQRLEGNLRKFFNTEPLYRKIDIYLLVSGRRSGGGGANVGSAKLTLECGGRHLDQKINAIMGLYHELAHLSFGKFGEGHYGKLLETFVRRTPKIFKTHSFATQKRSYRILINEGVVSSLLPEGYLTEKCFGGDESVIVTPLEKEARIRFGPNYEYLPRLSDNFESWRIFCALEMRDTTKDYIESHRPVDRAYLEKVRETFKKFVALSRR